MTVFTPPTPAVVALLDRVRSGGVLVTGHKTTPRKGRRMLAEVDGRPVPTTAVRDLIRRGLIRPVSATAGTTTWAAVAEGNGDAP